ncbi:MULTISPECIES: hypothetical protein [unclassified Streptomyces]|uniref:hypothetical protein n=1 Tax=unclassified Streptomyces TaxID=2593676 RepID=UPI000311F27D|nr:MULTISPECIES: hypothetical protein [unclassified Streptomyces]NED74149.1 hypothetical protein [Streptomyces sp. SID9944]NMO34244.1 hypothetical protein [Streptomyces sp. GMY02]
MPARTHTRTRPANTGGVDTRLPWWALALPALAFAALLALLWNPSNAHAAAADPATAQLWQHIRELLTR